MSVRQSVRDSIEYDDSRDSVPNEHGLTALAGTGLAVCALLTRNRVHALLGAMAAGALLFRAAAGRDGLRKWAGVGEGDVRDLTDYPEDALG